MSPSIHVPKLNGVQTLGLMAVNQNLSKFFRMANKDRIATIVTMYGRPYAIIIPGPEVEVDAAMRKWRRNRSRAVTRTTNGDPR